MLVRFFSRLQPENAKPYSIDSGNRGTGKKISEPPKENKTAFISYRREGGSETARLLRSELTAKDVSVFLDMDDMRSAHFDIRLMSEIEKADNFIVILSKHSLDRCVNEGDWLRSEIAHAIKLEKTIVPLLKDGFTFPDATTLPEDIRELPRHNGVGYSHEYFHGCIEKLLRFLN